MGIQQSMQKQNNKTDVKKIFLEKGSYSRPDTKPTVVGPAVVRPHAMFSRTVLVRYGTGTVIIIFYGILRTIFFAREFRRIRVQKKSFEKFSHKF